MEIYETLGHIISKSQHKKHKWSNGGKLQSLLKSYEIGEQLDHEQLYAIHKVIEKLVSVGRLLGIG